MKKIYICGPITNCPDYEKEFKAREMALRAMGYYPVSPVPVGKRLIEFYPERKVTHEEFMNATLPLLLDCEGITLLDGWENSEGAKLEYEVAKSTGKKFVKVVLFK